MEISNVLTYYGLKIMNTLMSPQASLVVGIVLMLLGSSFLYKAAIAGSKGSVQYWSGFLPLSLISPFVLHLPASKNSLVKRAEGLWVYLLMAPAFLIVSMLCFISGAEYAGLPAVDSVNHTVRMGSGGPPLITFSKTEGFNFPAVWHAAPGLAKMFNVQVNLDPSQKMVPENQGSYNDAMPSH